jgi:hypothetical protein
LWHHELDDLPNPHLMDARSDGPALPVLELAKRMEAADPRVQAVSIPMSVEPGESLSIFVLPRVDLATGQLYDPGYNQVFLDPAREFRSRWLRERETASNRVFLPAAAWPGWATAPLVPAPSSAWH